MHEGSQMCLDTLAKDSKVAGLYLCHNQGGSQVEVNAN